MTMDDLIKELSSQAPMAAMLVLVARYIWRDVRKNVFDRVDLLIVLLDRVDRRLGRILAEQGRSDDDDDDVGDLKSHLREARSRVRSLPSATPVPDENR